MDDRELLDAKEEFLGELLGYSKESKNLRHAVKLAENFEFEKQITTNVMYQMHLYQECDNDYGSVCVLIIKDSKCIMDTYEFKANELKVLSKIATRISAPRGEGE